MKIEVKIVQKTLKIIKRGNEIKFLLNNSVMRSVKNKIKTQN